MSANLSRGLCTSATRSHARVIALSTALLVAGACDHAVVAPLALMNVAAARGETLVITTEKPLGPVPGTFSTSGAFVDTGVLITQQRIVSALPAPFGVVTHLVLLFEGQQGTFTIRTEIKETLTGDEHIFANEGTWVFLGGTGAYAALHGTGRMEGTVDDSVNLITRIYTGQVFFN
jgi:hypothetical protein